MFINNTIIASKNFNHLKLTPEKLAEWGDRHSSITSKYFNLSQQSPNKVQDNSQDQEINHECEIYQECENFLLFSGQENDDSNRSVHERNLNSLLVSNELLQVEKQEDNMSLDDDDGFRDYLKDSEYIRNIDQSDMNLQQDYCENMNIDIEAVEGCETFNKDNPVSKNKSNLNSSIISDQNNNLPKKGSSNFLKTMHDVVPTVVNHDVVNHEINQENSLHEHLDALNKERHSTDNQDETYFNAKQALQCKSIFSNEKYNKMKEVSRLRASNPNISHFMKTVIPNKKSDFDRDMEVCSVT